MPADPQLVKKLQPPRVLIADDASGMRTYLRLVLESGGFACTEVADGGAAFDEVLKSAFDVVITDLEMPGMDGFQLLSAISLLPSSRRPAVIVVSALLDETLAERRPELRAAAALLAKPVQPADLLKSIGKVLNQRAVCR
ncbi:MAG: response regulator [Hyphomonadaceae bacterium]|nr:response regulator [Hyphomonadaceae bacterium]